MWGTINNFIFGYEDVQKAFDEFASTFNVYKYDFSNQNIENPMRKSFDELIKGHGKSSIEYREVLSAINNLNNNGSEPQKLHKALCNFYVNNPNVYQIISLREFAEGVDKALGDKREGFKEQLATAIREAGQDKLKDYGDEVRKLDAFKYLETFSISKTDIKKRSAEKAANIFNVPQLEIVELFQNNPEGFKRALSRIYDEVKAKGTGEIADSKKAENFLKVLEYHTNNTVYTQILEVFEGLDTQSTLQTILDSLVQWFEKNILGVDDKLKSAFDGVINLTITHMDIIEKNSSNYVNREDTGKTNHVQNEGDRIKNFHIVSQL